MGNRVIIIATCGKSGFSRSRGRQGPMEFGESDLDHVDGGRTGACCTYLGGWEMAHTILHTEEGFVYPAIELKNANISLAERMALFIYLSVW